MRYAHLDVNGIVTTISDLHSEEISDNLILINDLEVKLGSTYNRETGEFTAPKPQPYPEPQPTLEEKLARMERQLEEQALVQLEVLATIYEEIVMKG